MILTKHAYVIELNFFILIMFYNLSNSHFVFFLLHVVFFIAFILSSSYSYYLFMSSRLASRARSSFFLN
jgi:hypothetical protein